MRLIFFLIFETIRAWTGRTGPHLHFLLNIRGVEGQFGKYLVQILAAVVFFNLLLELSYWISWTVVGKRLDNIIFEGKRGLSHVAVPVLWTGSRIKVVKVVVKLVCPFLIVKPSLQIFYLQHLLVRRWRCFDIWMLLVIVAADGRR